MALSFYLNEIDNNHKINVQTNASFTSKVGDFDVGTLTLEWNKTKNKIAPYTKLFIVDSTNDDTWCFVVLNDEVEIVKKTPNIYYLHNLTVIQNTYELTTHLVRNSVFSQPIAPKIAKLKATGCALVQFIGTIQGMYSQFQLPEVYIARDENEGEYVYIYERTQFSIREKLANVYLNVQSLACAYQTSVESSDFTISDGREWVKNPHTLISFTVKKYETEVSTEVIGDPLVISVTNGRTYVPLNKTFFEPGYWYQLELNLGVRPLIGILPEYEILNPDQTPTQGQSWNVPSIQVLFNCALVLETYYYNLGDVLRTLRNQTSKTYNSIETKEDLFSVITTEPLSIIAPNFSFTSQDLWSCVADVLKYIDAIPTLDEYNNLGFEYLNDYSRTPIEMAKVDEKSSLSNQYYTNSLVANYQNAKQDNAIIYPAKGLFKRVSSKVYGVPTTDDYELRVPKPIDYIDGVYILLKNNNSYDFQVQFDTNASLKSNIIAIQFDGKLPDPSVDISDTIYEHSLYSLLPMGSEFDYQNANQLNSLYYDRGSNSVYLGGVNTNAQGIKYETYKRAATRSLKGVFGILQTNLRVSVTLANDLLPNIFDLQYCIKYHAIFDGRASQESTTNKHPGETYATQEQGGANLNRMGNNMQGAIARLGNESEIVSIPVTEYGSRIKKGSLWVDDDGKKYIANSVKTTFSTSSQNVMVEAQFSRNFNLISQFTRLDQEKRFYEIDNNLISKGYENITEFLYFSAQSAMGDQEVAMTENMINGVLKHTLILENNNPQEKADFATLDSFYFINDDTPTNRNIYIPFHAYGLGNSICFEMGFESPINAEDKLLGDSGTLKNETALYTSDDGFADGLTFKMYYSKKTESDYFGANFPSLTTYLNNNPNSQSLLFQISKLAYYKKPNEIVHLNYSIAFMPKPGEDVFFGDTLINKNGIIQEIENNPRRELYLYAGDELYSIIDNKVLSSHQNYGMVSVTFTKTPDHLSGEIVFERYVPEPITSAKAWAIADGDGNIYFAVNQEIEDTTSVKLYFAARRFRL